MSLDNKTMDATNRDSIDVSEKASFLVKDNVNDIDVESAKHDSQRRRWTRLIVSLLAVIALTLTFISSYAPGCMMGPREHQRSVSSIHHLNKRADSPTDACLRYGQQSAVVNGSLYLYGGSTTRSNSFTNNLISINLKKTWNVARPEFTALPQPSNAQPAVANGFLWNSYDSLFQFGGRFSDGAVPSPVTLSDFGIKSKAWTERVEPRTNGGNNSEPANVALSRVAFGGGVSIAAQGKGYYFGGILAGATNASSQYLRSMVEYTFPGYGSTGVTGLSLNVTAGADGAFRNITTAGIQAQAGFTPRGHNVLQHFPGWGIDGVILSIAGGDNNTGTLMPMNIIEVYDVQTSEWFRQPTEGTPPRGRLNPCVVSTTAADGSSFSVHMFGGQAPGPNGTLYNDMWVLSVPAFTWIQVNTSDSAPAPRAGHTCDLWDGQMIIVGGDVAKDVACDAPGVYVFNTSALDWTRQFIPLSGDDNPFSQQYNQRGATKDSGLRGSYAYKVPAPIVAKIGGNPDGLATVTVPLLGDAAWAKTTSVSYDTASMTPTATPTPPPAKSGGTNIGAAIAGAVAGFFFLIAVYLALCAIVYRQQIAAYRRHITKADAARSGHRVWGGDAGAASTKSRKTSWFSGRGGSQKSEESDNSHTALGGKGELEDSLYGAGHTSPEPPPRSPRRLTAKTFGNGLESHSSEDLTHGVEPSFWGVVTHPRANLRVVNK